MPDDQRPNQTVAASGPHLEQASGFPHESIPTVFADGIANIAPSAQVVKFYLFRTDPDVGGAQSYRNQTVAQVVMSMDGFAASAVFLYNSLQNLIDQGLLDKNRFDEISRLVSTKL